jgi:osmotically-inducible protein OsmY
MNFNQTLVRLVAAGLVSASSMAVLAGGTPVEKKMATVSRAQADSRLADLVLVTLLTDPVLTNERIEVIAKEGRVTLSGVLDHDAKRSRALEIVSYVPGVREVRSDMELSSGKGR